jgi:hypothetical protein
MFLLACRACLELIRIDLEVSKGNFAALYRRVRSTPLRRSDDHFSTVEAVCRAVDLASVWYWKRVQCLQRSAAATCLLRRHGVPAQLVLGAQLVPFRAHAWVEVDGHVVNDASYVPELYTVMDRC